MMSIRIKKGIYLLLIATLNRLASQTTDICNTRTEPSITIFAHGVLDSGRHQILQYVCPEKPCDARATIQKPYRYFNFPDACEPWNGIKLCKFWNCSFGQDNDIEKLAQIYTDTTQKVPDQSITLYGVSRGASVIWSFVAKKQPKNLKFMILESPYDRIQTSLRAAADHIPTWINYNLTRYLAEAILRTIACKFKAHALQPIDMANTIPLDVPNLTICSLEDKLVPAASSYALYKALQARGHQHAYVLVLSKGKHAQLLQGPQGDLYAQIVHAFKKKYGSPHNPQLAQKGELLLPFCQPTHEHVMATESAVSTQNL